MTASAADIHLSKVLVDLPNGRRLFSIQNLSLPFGSHVLIQGESGTGKTTLLHLIAGLFTPDGGAVNIGTTSLNSLSDSQRCELRRIKIGVIFQKLNLIDHLTVAENISLPLLHAPAEGRQHEVLNRVNLSARANDRCSYLSVGEQQRVAVARVLMQAPDIILADEPTSSLDRKNSDFVLSALKDAAKGKTLIVVSHDERIAGFFDRVIAFGELR